MGQQAPTRAGMCCSVREKDGRRLAADALGAPQFTYSEIALDADKPRHLAFSPLWSQGAAGQAQPRRLALASDKVVQVYRITNAEDDRSEGALPELALEYSLDLGQRRTVTALRFRDEESSRHLVVALTHAPGLAISALASEEAGPAHSVRVWGMVDRATSSSGGRTGSKQPAAITAAELQLDEGYLASLDDHTAPVTRLAANTTYLFTADSAGECRAWHKTRSYALRASAQLHQSAVVDLTVDRLFLYSAGSQDQTIRVWSSPDLKPVLSIGIELPRELCASIVDPRAPSFATDEGKTPDVIAMPSLPSAPSSASPAGAAGSGYRLTALTALRRPLSRWSGSQGSTRNNNTPKGVLFVAGVLSAGPNGIGRGAGVLMEWSLAGEKAVCRSAQIAHDMPIVSLAYGPYDNGPLITVDARGQFRVWDVTPKLWCSQRVDVGLLGGDPGGLAIAVDPMRRGFFAITGGKRLLVWGQMRTQMEFPAATADGPSSPLGEQPGSPADMPLLSQQVS
eukprot:TRINITY_DN122437_c0_g1_i1.p1 TRINITY_DN122437_c0_g1~~TRINITY_DN122437_c0_g1_i1.p1  ORF type:complete len:511 (+),score=86.91 TRINITY_DN122437_c0_g1_i1:154-1686(+)